MVEIEAIGAPLEVGTRVHWDAATETLLYVDVALSELYCYKPSSGKITKVKVGNEPLGFAFPVEGTDGKFIAVLGRKFIFFQWDRSSPTVTNCVTIGEVDTEPDLMNNRLNGGKVDPTGRLWAGSMGGPGPDGKTVPGKGSLFSVTRGKIQKHDSNIGISNGLAFSLNLGKMYYVDTLFRGVFQYDYDPTTGIIGNKEIIFTFDEHNISGSPDGLTIDEDGNLWVAVIFGSAVIQFDPRTGDLLQRIHLNTPEVTAVTWGDKTLDVLFVNTAKMPIDGVVPPDPAGCTFRIKNLKSRGLPGDRYVL